MFQTSTDVRKEQSPSNDTRILVNIKQNSYDKQITTTAATPQPGDHSYTDNPKALRLNQQKFSSLTNGCTQTKEVTPIRSHETSAIGTSSFNVFDTIDPEEIKKKWIEFKVAQHDVKRESITENDGQASHSQSSMNKVM